MNRDHLYQVVTFTDAVTGKFLGEERWMKFEMQPRWQEFATIGELEKFRSLREFQQERVMKSGDPFKELWCF